MTFEKQQSAGYLANHMARLFATGLARRIKPLGLAPGQFMVLLELWENDGVTQADLVVRLDVEQATLSHTLARMLRDGLITRRASDTDKRSQVIHLTDKAHDLRAPATTAAQAQNEQALSGMSRDEQAQFTQLMTKAIHAMQRG
ncbi:MAG: MarR family transcriptional regulator [Parasphingorhabdus sp.]|uniref:MarR family winged helix-turn-helix transcriptional regulator n=1 Tax=Parasphingorhabdus sp. TaxID=2709688 RepID=UPI003298EBBE